MIRWKDFILDDEVGPVLASAELVTPIRVLRRSTKGSGAEVCREKRFGSPSVMEDAIGTNGIPEGILIQETRREQRPARMVGLTDLEFAKTGMEASRSDRTQLSWRRGER